MKLIKSLILGLITIFMLSIALPSCSVFQKNKQPKKVKSGTGMGNKKDKNRHVWGRGDR